MRAAAGLALLAMGCSAAPIELATLGTGELTNGLVAHWSFDEGTGGSVNDSSGNGHDGLAEGPAWSWQSGQFGSAVGFSGADLVAVANFPPATRSYSVSAWVRIASSDVGPLVGNLISTEILGGGWALYTMLTPGSLKYAFRFYGVNAPPQYAPYWTLFCNCLTTDVWTHVTAVLDGDAGTLSLYVGAAAPVTMSVTTGILPGSTTLNIGRSTLQQPGAAFPLTGQVDDVAIYSRPLAAEEVARLGAAPAPDPR